ncbi:BQ5605_C026g10129 [Microbotryum silenes-dioicae]|uniref:BQ5605_C026g10129 protein n=1 Tax=Microbotryum silenes-dioicae TaxID=796604 RepID=A0A2X0N8U9_9BASI|nr:BQ5605_C026g10129 [Microbotryum silenes-dioicae]
MSAPSPLISPSQTPPPPGAQDHGVRFSTPPLRSPHFVSRAEAIKGLSNRFVFSWFYIYLYLAMAFLSLTTVVLSVLSDCPTFTFYMLEIIINTTMIVEVSIRLVAFGKQFWKSYYNTLDLIITILCMITLVVIFFSGCSAKGEEVFDVFLLVVRNLFQFGRLALVMRKSGKNAFTRPAPIDLSSARNYSFSLDLDLDDEEALSTERRALGGDLEAARVSRTIGAGLQGRKGAAAGGGEDRPFTLDDSDEED